MHEVTVIQPDPSHHIWYESYDTGTDFQWKTTGLFFTHIYAAILSFLELQGCLNILKIPPYKCVWNEFWANTEVMWIRKRCFLAGDTDQ